MNKGRKLHETVNICRITLKNRIAMAPIKINGFCDPTGTFARLAGGCIELIIGVFKVENTIEPERQNGKFIAG
jgi:hypothetical protein